MRFMYMRPRRDIFGHFAPFVVQYRYLLSALSSDCTKSLVTVRSHSTVPAALALSLGAPAGPSRSAGARRSGPIYSDRPARSARSKLRVRRAATGVGRRWRRTRAQLHTTHRGISSSVPGGTQGLEGGPGSPIASEGSRTLGPAAVGAAPGLVRDVELVC